MYGLTTHHLQVERRESHRANQVICLTHTPATGGEKRELIETIKCMRSPHTSYRLERRESHRGQSSVWLSPTHLATGGEERES